MTQEIDFDDASKCWRENKKYKGKGQFMYICNWIHSNGKRCRRTIVSSLLEQPYMNTFSGVEVNRYIHHKSRNIYCKRHIHR